MLTYGPTEQVFTRPNLELAFGGVLRHFDLPHSHDAAGGPLPVGIMTDYERPRVLVGGRSAGRSNPDSATAAPSSGRSNPA